MASQLQQPWKNASPSAALPTARDETWLEAYEGDKNLAGESSTGLQAEIKMNKVVSAGLAQPWKNASPSAALPTARDETWLEAYEGDKNLAGESSTGLQAEIKMNKVVSADLAQPWKNASPSAALPTARDETWLEAYEGDKNLAGESSTGLQAEIKMNKVISADLAQPWKNASPSAALPTARDETWLEAYEGDKNLAGESSTGLQAEIKMNKIITV